MGTNVHYTRHLREMWPVPLATEWARQYPQLFDEDDLRITRKQPTFHFCEWFAAIHLFRRDGAYSLIEKYGFRNHTRKREVIETLFPATLARFLSGFRAEFHVQPPDLLVFMPDGSSSGLRRSRGQVTG
jgi:hypothetical protein